MSFPVIHLRFAVKLLKALVLLVLVNLQVRAQVRINEVSPYNLSRIQDEDGDYVDWIELYNTGAVPVNLEGYQIIDTEPLPGAWSFPSYTLAPGDYVMVYASGKDKKEVIDHWETAISESSLWKYIVPASEPDPSWRTPAFNDASWNTGKGGIGYGDGDDSTVLAASVNSLYLRKTFTIDDTSALVRAMLHIDYDDGFIAFLNGAEIARSNVTGNLPSYNNASDSEHEAVVYKGGDFEKYNVDRATLRSVVVNGTNVLSIQVYNSSSASSDLTARAFLSFAMKDAGTQFPPVPSWFYEPASSFHTGFKLSNKGTEKLFLIDNEGMQQDVITIPSLGIDHSYGRRTDGAGTFACFSAPTSGSSNNASVAFTGYCKDSLIFSVQGGFYSSARTVTISGSSGIRFTLDGKEPSLASEAYTGPLHIASTTVVKAACMSAELLPATISTQTYFINEASTLPVISISADPADFFDDQTGIYMLGPDADSNNVPYLGANFWQDWERPVYVEYYDQTGKRCFHQRAGARIYGNYSRSNPMKSLLISSDDKYGKSSFDYQFYPDKNITSFRSFVLRNSGNDFNVTHFKDPLNQMAVFKKTAIDIQDYQPCVVFINGMYWGVHQIREKINEHYVSENHGIDKDLVDLTDMWAAPLEGSNNLWSLWWTATHTDLSVSAKYKSIADNFDLENMVDYFAAEIYISNWDWPTNNLKLWRPQTGDRKFRYIFWDTDISLGVWDMQPPSFNQLGRIKNGTDLAMGPHAEIFASMLKNTEFRNSFINRSADLMNTIYRPGHFTALAYAMRDQLAPEMPKHFSRWGSSVTAWKNNIKDLVHFIQARPGFARKNILTEFGLADTVAITLNVSPAGAGVIKINTVYPDNYPWSGVYFNGVPVTITAVPNPGYTFSGWQSPVLLPAKNANPSITLNVTLDETFTAYFEGAPAATLLTVSEINYHSPDTLDSGDWIELYNFGASGLNLAGWTFRDFNDYHAFVFPEGTVLPAGGRLVVCSDPVKFHEVYPSVTGYTGPFDFALDNDGDRIRLFDFMGNSYLEFDYDDTSPWDERADGQGYTLENWDPVLLNSPASWFTGCFKGSPGTGFLNSCITGNTRPSETASIAVYPNPAKGELHLEVRDGRLGNGSYIIIDALGQSVGNGTFEGAASTEVIDLSGTRPGIYNILITTEKGVFSSKIVREQ